MVLIFDMDGVLVNNHVWHFKAWAEFGRRHGINITEAEFAKHFGSTNELVLTSLFGNGITNQEIISMGNEKEAIYREIYKPFIKAVDGLPAFLQSASDKGLRIALATSAPSDNVKFTLEAIGLEQYFNVITDSSMISRGKPDPQVYQLTAEKLGVLPNECIVFEDSVPGIQSALNAGMQVIGVATTNDSNELLKYVTKIIMNFEASAILDETLLEAQK
jgi:HAD superfamily hydrolase (TIGR01509 family)